MSPKKESQKSAGSTATATAASTGFSDQERAAMTERAKELKELTAAVEAWIGELIQKAVS